MFRRDIGKPVLAIQAQAVLHSIPENRKVLVVPRFPVKSFVTLRGYTRMKHLFCFCFKNSEWLISQTLLFQQLALALRY